MKKKILSLIICLCMIIVMLPIASFASDTVTIKVIGDKDTANPGDTVNYTVSLGEISELASASFNLLIPSGMTYVENSAAIPAGLKTTLGMATVDWTENQLLWSCYGNTDGFASTSETTLLTFSCKVNTDATGTQNVSLTGVELFKPDNIKEIVETITPATVNIAAAPTAYTVTINPGANMTPATTITNTVTVGNGTDVSFTAADGYYFPNDYTVAAQNGVRVVRVNDTKISVTGTPTGDVNITLPDATEKPAATTYTVKVNGGTGVSVSPTSTGNSTQTVNQGEKIVPVVFEAWDNYYFPDNYGVNVGISGIAVTRNSPSKITVSGIPTADVTIDLPPATEKDTQEPPTVGHTDCTAAGVNDGTITGLTPFMQWKMGAGDNWNNVSSGETELTGRAPGTYYVRFKATDTKKASEPATVVINAYDPAVEKFTVTYKANGGTGEDHSVQVDKGSNHVILGADACGFTAPDKMRFVQWTTNPNDDQADIYPAGQELRNLQSDLTLYAVWETTDRTVFLNAGEGGGDDISVAVTYDQTYTLPGVPETFTAPNGKEFDCWKIQGDNTNTSYNPRDSYTIKGNVKFVAQWKDKQGGGEQPTTFTLTFKSGEGSGDNYVVNGIDTPQYTLPDVPDTFTAPAGKPIFAGWKAEGGNVVYPAGTVIPVNADATFVAQWKADGPQGDTVLVTFKPGDGTGDSFEILVPAGDYRLPPKPADFKAPAGKVFAGWRVQMDGNDLGNILYKAGQEFGRLTENVTFVAQWETRPYHVIITTPDTDSNKTNPGTGAAPVGAPIAVVIAVAVAGAAYFVTTKKR